MPCSSLPQHLIGRRQRLSALPTFVGASVVWSLFRRSTPTSIGTGVPKDSLIAVQGITDGLPHVWVVNQALDRFPGKAEYAWHLSIIIDMAEQAQLGLPTKAEQQVLGQLADDMRTHLQARDNALFVLSGTWNGERQLVFRVRDPDRAQVYLKSLVDAVAPVRQLEYLMEQDTTWALAEKYFERGRDVS